MYGWIKLAAFVRGGAPPLKPAAVWRAAVHPEQSRAATQQGAASGTQGRGTQRLEQALTHSSRSCGWTVPSPMASQECVDARDPVVDIPNPGMEGAPVPNGGKTCPVHIPGGEDTKRGFRKGIGRHNDYVKISVPDFKVSPLPMEWWKTIMAFFYAGFNLVLTTVVITVVHERVPPKESSPPLPDKFFDYIDRVNWAFTVTEINGMVLLAIWMIQLFFFRYKSIAIRRFFFLIGTLYLYRCVTMYITTLPVPGMHMTCAPKLHGDSHAKIQRILQLISGGGLSITNSHLLCGDFLYSGHTVMLTLTYLFIKECE
ncbi:phosphatidylcholine:ceramide cholinephosphotransferase 2 [Solea senegalensis]|uniref:Phosphatidylcholine:ceramide cholinephosphotransferase 2 n=1 Tax=Solea senegalensis TaxID=28829 RepID=A0AAV6Q9B3_SOLSE|nr:phosphatidylcholine:ceramide cholinephosphotransferase 2 [Solea senegalensis]